MQALVDDSLAPGGYLGIAMKTIQSDSADEHPNLIRLGEALLEYPSLHTHDGILRHYLDGDGNSLDAMMTEVGLTVIHGETFAMPGYEGPDDVAIFRLAIGKKSAT